MADIATIGLSLNTQQLEASAQRAAQALQQVNGQAQHTQQQLSQTGQSSTQASQSLRSLSDASQRSASAIRDLGTSLAGLAASVLSIRALSQAISSSVEASLKLQALTSAFTAIEGSAQAAASTLAFVRSEAERLGLSATTLADGFKTIDAAAQGTQLQGEGVRQIFASIAEAARVLGLSSEETQGALLAIGQSISKGAIQAEELRGQLGERLPGAFQIMARALGVTTEELDKMLESGTLKGQAMVDAWLGFAGQLHSQYGPAVESAAHGAGAEFTRLENAVTALAQAFGTGLLPALADAARAITEFIKLSTDTAKTLGGSLDPAIRATAVSILVLASGAMQAGKGIAAMMTLATEGVRGLKIALEDMAATGAQTDKIIKGLLEGTQPGAAFVGPPAPGAPAPAAVDQTAAKTKQALGILSSVKTTWENINKQAALTPTLVDRGKESMKATASAAEDIRKLFPGEAPPDVAAGLRDLERQYKTLEDQQDAQREAARSSRSGARASARAARQEEREQARADEERRDSIMQAGRQQLERLDPLTDLLAAQAQEREQLSMTRDEYERLQVVRALETAGIDAQASALGQKTLQDLEQLRVLRETSKAREELVNVEKTQAQALERLYMTQAQYDELTLRRTLGKAGVAEDDPRFQRALDTQEEIRRVGEIRQELERQPFVDPALTHAKDATQAFSDFFSNTILNATDIAKRGFAGFADSVVTQLQRIALQQYVLPQLQQWATLGLQALGLASGAGVATEAEAASAVAGYTAKFGDLALPRQHGGPVTAGQPYVVGESGAELFVPRQSGTIVPHNAPRGPNVVVHITTPDATSFLRSRGEVQQTMLRALQSAQRQA